MIRLSAVDRDRFGVVVARCDFFTAGERAGVLASCREARVELLIARCDASDYAAVHALEDAGARLMDTLVYYGRSLSGDLPVPESSATLIRPASADDARDVGGLARLAFRGYLGHYHTDPRLDPASADEGYADWAERSCRASDDAHPVFVATRSGALAGFLTARLNDARESEVVLNAVAPEFQGLGIYRDLLAAALAWARSKGSTHLIVSTQATNWPAQKAWVRAGFEPESARYTFHLWFTPSDR